MEKRVGVVPGLGIGEEIGHMSRRDVVPQLDTEATHHGLEARELSPHHAGHTEVVPHVDHDRCSARGERLRRHRLEQLRYARLRQQRAHSQEEG
jgi:hypothetical protein